MSAKIVFYKIRASDNRFECSCLDNDRNIIKTISSDKENFIDNIIDMFSYNCIFCSYGNFHYDDTVISYIIKNKNKFDLILRETKSIVKDIYAFSNTVLTEPEDKWGEYKYSNLFKSIDISVLLMPKKKRVSFEQAQYNLKLNTGDIIHDVRNIQYIYINYCIEELKVRKIINDEYKINSTSLDSVSTGISILRSLYLKETKLKWNSIKNKTSAYDEIVLKDIIFPYVKFNDKYLTNILENMKSLIVNKSEKYNKNILWKDSYINIGLGGLHSIEEAGVVKLNVNEIIIYADFNSMFSSIMVNNNIYPRHLDEKFIDVYKRIYYSRLESSGVKRMFLKWALNSCIGMFKKDNNWLCDPKAYYTITINSQLLLLMFAEKLFDSNLINRIVNWNTDGLHIIANKNNIDKIKHIINEFESDFNMQIKTSLYNSMIQYNGNNYIEFNNEESNCRGLFNIDTVIDKYSNFPIISMAINKYFMLGIDIEDTIRNNRDIFNFCTYYNKENGYNIRYDFYNYNNNTVRYYQSTKGKSLEKFKIDLYTNKEIAKYGISNFPCIICNDNSVFPDDIDYRFYIGKCRQLLNEIENVQLNLF